MSDVNFIKQYRQVQLKMSEDDKISPHQISLYWALFTLWNECGFATQLSINRNDVMRLSKIGNANTYTSCLKTLDKQGYIKYIPSYNPLIGSKVTIIRYDKCGDNGTAKGSGTTGDKGSGKGADTLYKLLNIKTIKLLNKNASLVNSNLEKWINSESEEKPKTVYSQPIFDCYDSCIEFFNDDLIPDTDKKKNDWLDAIEKLNRLDNLKFDDIIVLVQKTRQDEFWSKNFLSLPKLRKKNKEGIIYWKVFYNQFKNNNHAALTKAEQRDIDLANW